MRASSLITRILSHNQFTKLNNNNNNNNNMTTVMRMAFVGFVHMTDEERETSLKSAAPELSAMQRAGVCDLMDIMKETDGAELEEIYEYIRLSDEKKPTTTHNNGPTEDSVEVAIEKLRITANKLTRDSDMLSICRLASDLVVRIAKMDMGDVDWCIPANEITKITAEIASIVTKHQ